MFETRHFMRMKINRNEQKEEEKKKFRGQSVCIKD